MEFRSKDGAARALHGTSIGPAADEKIKIKVDTTMEDVSNEEGSAAALAAGEKAAESAQQIEGEEEEEVDAENDDNEEGQKEDNISQAEVAEDDALEGRDVDKERAEDYSAQANSSSAGAASDAPGGVLRSIITEAIDISEIGWFQGQNPSLHIASVLSLSFFFPLSLSLNLSFSLNLSLSLSLSLSIYIYMIN